MRNTGLRIAVVITEEGTGENSGRIVVILSKCQDGTHGVPIPLISEFDPPPHQSVRLQIHFELVLQLCDLIRDPDRLLIIIFKNFFQSIFRGGLLVPELPRLSSAQHCGGDMEQGVFHDLLIRGIAMMDLVIEPAHIPPPFSRWRSASRNRRRSPSVPRECRARSQRHDPERRSRRSRGSWTGGER